MSFVVLFGGGEGTGTEGGGKKRREWDIPQEPLPALCYHSPSVLALLPSLLDPGCFLMLLKAGSRGTGSKPVIFHLVFSETPEWVQEKPLTFQKGCQQWSSGTWKSDSCTFPSLENPTWERRALMLPQPRGLWDSHRALLISSAKPHPGCGRPGVPTGRMDSRSLAGEITCQ